MTNTHDPDVVDRFAGASAHPSTADSPRPPTPTELPPTPATLHQGWDRIIVP
ncbi:hypothetical protein ABZ619_40170 [Streptomyces sp. NPDC007851]|uniref:hypothetical protein n=1 Tax=Streptomyces sp. NPDC007851 TaxID=3155008 RepID=UPI0033D61E15